jgi:hypothetical protein
VEEVKLSLESGEKETITGEWGKDMFVVWRLVVYINEMY